MTKTNIITNNATCIYLLKSEAFTERMAAVSSSLGMVTCFTGATHGFPTMRQEWTSPFSLIILK